MALHRRLNPEAQCCSKRREPTMPGLKRSNMIEVQTLTLLLFACACATTSELRWHNLPLLAALSSPDEVRSEIPELYNPARFGSLIVVGNVVFGNPCSVSTRMAGGSSSTGVAGGSGSTGVAGGSTTTGVAGGSSTTGVAGGSTTTDVAGGSSTTGAAGGSTTTDVAGGNSATGVTGGSTAIQCATVGGAAGYLLRAPAAASILEFDGSAMHPVPASRIRR